MPVPKRRVSKSKRDSRRRSKKTTSGSSNICPNCKAFKRPHTVCISCGHYKGKPILI